jgi:LmbE family N-acetylglucosaminyl deacetylase
MTQQRSLLAIFAHPDDESYPAAGSLASYAAQGVDVYLICATKGEAGTISDPKLAYRDVLGAVREEELREACRAMGIHQPHILGYRDSGMAGTRDNRDPQSLNMARSEDVIGRVVHLIRQIRPDVIVTYDQEDIYGHPDHVAMSRYAEAAFHAAGDPDMYPDQINRGVEPHSPQRLFYVAIPYSRIEALAKTIPEEDQPEDEPVDPDEIGTPDDAVTVVMDVGHMYETKLEVVACHRTQHRPTDFFNRLPEEVRREFFSKEHFSQVLPPLDAGVRYTDLFEALDRG